MLMSQGYLDLLFPGMHLIACEVIAGKSLAAKQGAAIFWQHRLKQFMISMTVYTGV